MRSESGTTREIHATQIKELKISVTLTSGKKEFVTFTGAEIFEGSKNFIYQTETNFIGFKSRALLEDLVYKNISGKLFDDIRNGVIKKYERYSHIYFW
jgi:hypothetical protein